MMEIARSKYSLRIDAFPIEFNLMRFNNNNNNKKKEGNKAQLVIGWEASILKEIIDETRRNEMRMGINSQIRSLLTEIPVNKNNI